MTHVLLSRECNEGWYMQEGTYRVMVWCFSWLSAASSARRASLDCRRLRSSSTPSLPNSISRRPLRTYMTRLTHCLMQGKAAISRRC